MLNVFARVHITKRGVPPIPRAYRTITIRASSVVVEHCRGVALSKGWEFADLARTLICFAAYSSFLSLQNPQRLDRVKTIALLRQMSSYVGKAVGNVGAGRPYSPRVEVMTTLVTLHMPESLCDIISQYAAITGISRNEAYSNFLQHGLIILLKADNTFMKTILSIRDGTGSESDNRTHKRSAHD